ncbi:hypothetical protein ACIGXF_16770 [Streptomyces sp. NPDC053086]
MITRWIALAILAPGALMAARTLWRERRRTNTQPTASREEKP